jgi:4a-hydroxytetrahydrobiopterin dehydratase
VPEAAQPQPYAPSCLTAALRPKRQGWNRPPNGCSREVALRRYGSAITELVDELLNDHCREYPPGTPPLTEAEVARLRGAVPDWEPDGTGYLTREFTFGDFTGAFGLVAQVALLAQAESHHPRFELEWGRAAFTTWTQTAAGLTRNDFILAAKIDQLAGT